MREPTRRALIAAGGTIAAVSVAGCTSGDSSDDSGTDRPTTDERSTGDIAGTTAAATEPATSNGLPTRAEVAMTSMPTIAYEPLLVHVATGGTVVWRLDSGNHDATAYHPETKPPNNDVPPPRRIPADAEPWASPSLSLVGETYEHTFEVPGVYDYVDTEVVCTSHTLVGNVGRVIVGWPDPEDQPALEPPQDQIPALVATKFEELNRRTEELFANGPPSDAPNVDK
jgi:plastocyanin